MTPTLTKLIDELERLDAAATPGPWYAAPYRRKQIDADGNLIFEAVKRFGPNADKDIGDANTDLVRLIGTHRGAILAHLKRLAELEGRATP